MSGHEPIVVRKGDIEATEHQEQRTGEREPPMIVITASDTELDLVIDPDDLVSTPTIVEPKDGTEINKARLDVLGRTDPGLKVGLTVNGLQGPNADSDHEGVLTLSGGRAWQVDSNGGLSDARRYPANHRRRIRKEGRTAAVNPRGDGLAWSIR